MIFPYSASASKKKSVTSNLVLLFHGLIFKLNVFTYWQLSNSNQSGLDKIHRHFWPNSNPRSLRDSHSPCVLRINTINARGHPNIVGGFCYWLLLGLDIFIVDMSLTDKSTGRTLPPCYCLHSCGFWNRSFYWTQNQQELRRRHHVIANTKPFKISRSHHRNAPVSTATTYNAPNPP